MIEKIKRILVAFFVLCVATIVGSIAKEEFSSKLSTKEINKKLAESADRLNKNLPMMVDSGTELISTAGINKTFRYNYRMVDYAASEIDPVLLREQMRPKVKNFYCSSSDLKEFRKIGVSIMYLYFGKDSKEITKIKIKPSECS